MIKKLLLITFIFLRPLYSSALDTTSTSVLTGDHHDREFTQKYWSVLNLATGKGIGIRNSSTDTITVAIEYGIWLFRKPLLNSDMVTITIPARKSAAIVDFRIKIEHIRSILRLWVNEILLINKTREDICEYQPILSYHHQAGADLSFLARRKTSR